MQALAKLSKQVLQDRLAALEAELATIRGATPSPTSITPGSLEEIMGKVSGPSVKPEVLFRAEELATFCRKAHRTCSFGQAAKWLFKTDRYLPSTTGQVLAAMKAIGADHLVKGKKGYAPDVKARHEAKCLSEGIIL